MTTTHTPSNMTWILVDNLDTQDRLLLLDGHIMMTYYAADADDDGQAMSDMIERLHQCSAMSLVTVDITNTQLQAHAGCAPDECDFTMMADCALNTLLGHMPDAGATGGQEDTLEDALNDAAVILYDGEAYRVTQYDSDDAVIYAVNEETGEDVSLGKVTLQNHGCKVMTLTTVFDNCTA